MKFSIDVLLPLVAMVWGHDDHDDCDVTSHLATRVRVTKVAKVTATESTNRATPLISEFQPFAPLNPPGIRQVEISGTPLENYEGCIWTIDGRGGR